MKKTWSEQFIDTALNRAWLDFRLDLAGKFSIGLEASEMEPIDITAPTGETVTAGIEDDHIVIRKGDQTHVTDNVDEAAFFLAQILRSDWEVLHPVFLDSTAYPVVSVPDNKTDVLVPTLGRAESREQLQAWAKATLSDWLGSEVRAMPDGTMPWRTRGNNRVFVRVPNQARIQLVTVVAERVSFRKAHLLMDELARKTFGLKFHLDQDRLVMSQVLIADPFVPEQLPRALRSFMFHVDQLGWVADKVMSKRAVADRSALDQAVQARADAERELQAAQEQLTQSRQQQSDLRAQLRHMRGQRLTPAPLPWAVPDEGGAA